MADARSGLTCFTSTLEAGAAPRVVWIAWDSPFRGRDLRIGDRLVAVNGTPIAALPANSLPGLSNEASTFTALGLAAGSMLTLTVDRRTTPRGWQRLTVAAPLAAPPSPATDASGRRLVAPGGPDTYDSAGFSSGGWAGWYDKLTEKFQALFDTDRLTATTVTRAEARMLAETNGARVDHALAQFPCDWSRMLKADYDAALAAMTGAPVTLAPGALDFRRRGEELAAQVRVKAQAAWATASAGIEPVSPAPNPARDDIRAFVGRTVLLPEVGNSGYVSDAGHNWFACGDGGGYVFIDAEGPAAQAMLVAGRRYAKLVDPNLAARWRMTATLTDMPRLIRVGDRAFFGLVAEPVAALVGDAMFVDLSGPPDAVRFAGEDGLVDDTPDLPPADASPSDIVRAVVAAVKAADLALWRALHADWLTDTISNDKNEQRTIIIPAARRIEDSRFEDQRRSLMGRVIDAWPEWEDAPEQVLGPRPGADAPRLEAVTVWVQHAGLADGAATPTTFCDVTVQPRWRIERYAGGPWRVAEAGRL